MKINMKYYLCFKLPQACIPEASFSESCNFLYSPSGINGQLARMGAGGGLLGCLPPKAKKLTLQVYRARNQNQNL